MRIAVSQQNKKILITFKQGSAVDNYSVDKSDEFLGCVDKFFKKRKMRIESLKKTSLEFSAKGGNMGILTERVIRATLKGLYF